MVDRSDVGVGAQTRLQRVLAVESVDRIGRILRDSASLRGELVGQEPPVPTRFLAESQLHSLGEFWQAIGGKPKATLQYGVTVGLDIFDDLVASGDLVDGSRYRVEELRAALAPLRVGEELTWTLDGAGETYIEDGLPVACISRTNLIANADKVPAAMHQRCGR